MSCRSGEGWKWVGDTGSQWCFCLPCIYHWQRFKLTVSTILTARTVHPESTQTSALHFSLITYRIFHFHTYFFSSIVTHHTFCTCWLCVVIPCPRILFNLIFYIWLVCSHALHTHLRWLLITSQTQFSSITDKWQMAPRVGGKYRLGKKIGSSSFGKHCQLSLSSKHWLTSLAPGNIYLGINIISGEEVGIKLKSMKAKHPHLEYESKVYNTLTGGPFVQWFGTECDYNTIVMNILGPSLEDFFNFCNCKFSLKTVLLLEDQLVSLGKRLVFILALILISHHFA